MDFRILGPLEVLDKGHSIALGGSKQRTLLALLLLHANETLTTDRLIDELWGEHPPSGAAKTVQVQISRLRKALAGGGGRGPTRVIVTRERGYELRLDPDCLDSHSFERLVAEGRSELVAGRLERAVSAFEGALSLWRGPPLAELAYEPFAQREIARLDDLRVAAYEQLIEARLALGGHAEVVAQLKALIDENPYRERLRAQLMLALYRSDRQAEALQAFQEARTTLVEQLGIEPSERLRELERAILTQDPELQLMVEAEPATAEPPAATSLIPFVGRNAEQGELVAGLDDVFAGRGRLFLLAGEPGIGKSRLAEELMAHARARAARVLVGRCWEAGGAPAFWPWIQALRTHVRENDAATLRSQLGVGAVDLAQIIPELRERFPDLPEPPSLDSDAARFRLFDAAAEFLRRASGSRPIVLVLDDLHAADTPSLLLLRFLARTLPSTQLLVLAVYRDVDPFPRQPLTEMLAELAREPVTRRLQLGGLSEREVAEYVELMASETTSSELVPSLHKQTEGNPLFVGEFVRLLAVEGARSESSVETRLAIPQSVRDVIARRLDYLSEGSSRALVLASVIGREFALDTLARTSGVGEDELLEMLDEAIAARVVAEVPGEPGRLRFAHVLIRDALYEGLTGATRLRMHKLVVEALEALYGPEPGAHLAELAYHATAGSNFDKGRRYAQRAGDRALGLLAYEESARLYGSALKALELAARPDEECRCELLLSLGEAESRAGNSSAAKQAFLDAAEIARVLGLPRDLARAASGYGGRIVWARAGSDTRLVPLLEEALAALAEEDVELRARLNARLAGALRDEHSRERRDRLSREAVELARDSKNAAALAYALDGRSASIIAPDTVAERLALATELRDVAEGIGDGERIVQAHFHRIMAQLQVGDVRGVEVDLAEADRIAHELRVPAQIWQVLGVRAMLALAAGKLPEAEELVPRALALGEHALPTAAVPVHRIQLYTLRDFQGRLDEVEPAIRHLVAEYPARRVFCCVLAHVHARLGQLPEARRAFVELARDRFSALPFDQEWLYGMSLLAETSALLDDTDSAQVLYGLLVPWASMNAVDQAEGIRGAISRYLGILATATKRLGDAEQHFEQALAMNAAMGARPWLAHTQTDYARMLHGRNGPRDRKRARDLLEAALRNYRELGMQSHAAKVATPAQQLSTSP